MKKSLQRTFQYRSRASYLFISLSEWILFFLQMYRASQLAHFSDTHKYLKGQKEGK